MSPLRALVSGASRGIGQAIAERFETAGVRVRTPSREESEFASSRSVRGFLKRERELEVDILVNNAGENKINLIEAIDLADWERIMATNLTAAFLLMQHFGPRMAARGWGRIVNISSCYGFLSRPGRGAYGASKAALNAITRTAALELGLRNVLVNAIAPGFVETEMTRRNTSPEQIAHLAGQTAL